MAFSRAVLARQASPVRAWSILPRAGLHVGRRCSSTSGDQAEFTIHPYRDRPELGFERSSEFCMVTLRHPDLVNATRNRQLEMYRTKYSDRVVYVDALFKKYDKTCTGFLNADELRGALSSIRVPSTEFRVSELLQRHGPISLEEFRNVVTEAWGRAREVDFSCDLAEMHAGMAGHFPLNHCRAILFVGRASPVHWTLRSLRHIWPAALVNVQVMRNTSENPNLDPALMEVCMKTYARSGIPGLLTTLDLAIAAAKHSPTAKGGFCVRLVPVADGGKNAARGEEMLVPLRGLPENRSVGLVTQLKARFWGH
eukprot:CAMPEP_0170611988 /NCGR_PEP_ID=MMETSP0224-20130122/23482_1 /TAXON_ID=285029 /ORGANISM="Togula jolla, Strain CCCM 725" /LENGTH=310 /DNA_ID=CAMNT_0010937459 /DNA_START=40 /DNA_END=972 /DNA_ORIENTATION=+